MIHHMIHALLCDEMDWTVHVFMCVCMCVCVMRVNKYWCVMKNNDSHIWNQYLCVYIGKCVCVCVYARVHTLRMVFIVGGESMDDDDSCCCCCCGSRDMITFQCRLNIVSALLLSFIAYW